MTLQEFQALADLLELDPATIAAAHANIIEGQDPATAARTHSVSRTALESALTRIRTAELRIRGAFVQHRPDCWEIIVGHEDHHLAPGMTLLAVGDAVRLLCARVRVMVPVIVTQTPETPRGYYSGVVQDVEASSMRYRRGDGVRFSDDQVLRPSHARKPRRPIPL